MFVVVADAIDSFKQGQRLLREKVKPLYLLLCNNLLFLYFTSNIDTNWDEIASQSDVRL